MRRPPPRPNRPPRRPPHPSRLVAALVLLLAPGLAGCGGDGAAVRARSGGVDHVDALAQERRTAREAMLAVLAVAWRGSLAASSAETSGHWDGCVSTYPTGYRSYRYLTDAAVYVGEAPAPVELAGLLSQAGAEDVRRERSVGVVRVGGRLDGLAVSLTSGGGPVIAARVLSDCVRVPYDERHEWGRRQERHPGYGSW